VQKAKELMPSLGRIISTHIRAYQNWGDKWNDTGERPVEASGVMKSYGGGILHCGGSHIFDLVLFFLGRPHRLYATMYKPEWLDYDIQAAAFLETANGIVHYEALAHPLKKIGFLRDGWDEKVEINGVNGRLEIYSSNWHEVDCKSSILLHYDNHDGSLHEYRFDPESPFNRAMKFFCGNISAKIQGAQSRFTGYEVDELISNTQLSSAEKKAVGIDWKI
jgi:predicted dehydrogenase